MAFEKSIHLADCKYRYTISSNVKKFTLRDTTFVQNKIGNYELHRLLEKVPNSGEGFPLKILQEKFYFVMQSLVDRQVFEQEEV